MEKLRFDCSYTVKIYSIFVVYILTCFPCDVISVHSPQFYYPHRFSDKKLKVYEDQIFDLYNILQIVLE